MFKNNDNIHERMGQLFDELNKLTDLDRPTKTQRERAVAVQDQIRRPPAADPGARSAAGPGALSLRAGGLENGSSGASGPQLLKRTDPWGFENRSDPYRATFTRDRALAAIERCNTANDSGRELIIQALERARDEVETSDLAKWATLASGPNCRSAFLHLARDPQNGHRMWTEPQLAASAR